MKELVLNGREKILWTIVCPSVKCSNIRRMFRRRREGLELATMTPFWTILAHKSRAHRPLASAHTNTIQLWVAAKIQIYSTIGPTCWRRVSKEESKPIWLVTHHFHPTRLLASQKSTTLTIWSKSWSKGRIGLAKHKHSWACMGKSVTRPKIWSIRKLKDYRRQKSEIKSFAHF